MTNEITIQDAAAAVYRKYGANLAAFWRDAFAAEAQKHGDPVEQHGLDGNCIHYVPICHRCRIVTVEHHLKDKDAIRAEEREAAWQPIETAPKDGTRILLVRGDYVWLDEWWKGTGANSNWCSHVAWTQATGKIPDPPTHWMPLPAVPVLETTEK